MAITLNYNSMSSTNLLHNELLLRKFITLNVNFYMKLYLKHYTELKKAKLNSLDTSPN
jgi:hypothetical protein